MTPVAAFKVMPAASRSRFSRASRPSRLRGGRDGELGVRRRRRFMNRENMTTFFLCVGKSPACRDHRTGGLHLGKRRQTVFQTANSEKSPASRAGSGPFFVDEDATARYDAVFQGSKRG